jgi:hypothetical protein
MEVLVGTNEAANILGLSVQGVHYRIKTKKLKSIKKDNKTFVYVEKNLANKVLNNNEQAENLKLDVTNEIIKLKDEQISFLKKSITWITKRNNQEIQRLQSAHDKTVDAFKSEISLLQKAYNELHKLYSSATQNVEYKADEQKFISTKEFVLLLLNNGKTPYEIKKLILQRVKIGDKRFVYNSYTKELRILNDSFKDIL